MYLNKPRKQLNLEVKELRSPPKDFYTTLYMTCKTSEYAMHLKSNVKNKDKK